MPYLGGLTTSTTVMGEDRPAAAVDGLLAAALDEPLPAPPALHQYRVREQVEVAVVRAWPHGPQAADAYRAPNTLPFIQESSSSFHVGAGPWWGSMRTAYFFDSLAAGAAGFFFPPFWKMGASSLAPPLLPPDEPPLPAPIKQKGHHTVG